MNVMERNGKWFTPDNRRLWVFRTAEEIGFLKTVKVNVIYNIPNNKFTTVNDGQSVRLRKGYPGGKIWRNWKPQRPTSDAVKSRETSYYLNRSDVSSGNTFTRRYTTIRDNLSYSYNQNRHGTHLSFHSNSSQNCDSLCPVSYHEEVTKLTRGVIFVGGLDNKMQLDTEQLSQRQGKDLYKKSSDIKSTERADYDNSDDAQSSKPSVMADRQTSFDQSCENRNNMDDVQSHKSSILSARQASFDQSCENRNNMDDVRSHIPSVISDRQTSLDQSWEIGSNLGDVQSYKSLILSDRQASLDQSWGNRNKLGDVQSYKSSVMSDRQTNIDQSWGNRNNADVDQISVKRETLGSTTSLRLKKEEDGCCCVIL